MVVDPDRSRRLAAIEALGDIGDVRTGPVLLPLIDEGSGTSTTGRALRRDADITMAAVLALGKIGDFRAVRAFGVLARAESNLALHSTVVQALGLVGGSDARDALVQIETSHPHPLVRAQALQTRATLDRQPVRRNP
jgi:HEAT repeat protein